MRSAAEVSSRYGKHAPRATHRPSVLLFRQLLHGALYLDFSILATLGAEEMGPRGPDVDEHRTPACVLKAALGALLPVVDVVAVLADEDGPLHDDRPPDHGPARRGCLRTGLAVGNLRDSYRRRGRLVGGPRRSLGWGGQVYGRCWRHIEQGVLLRMQCPRDEAVAAGRGRGSSPWRPEPLVSYLPSRRRLSAEAGQRRPTPATGRSRRGRTFYCPSRRTTCRSFWIPSRRG